MANHKSTLKRIRSNETKRLRNKYIHKTTRNAIKELREAEDKKTAVTLMSGLRRAQSDVDNSILEIQNSMIVYGPEEKAAAQNLIRQAQKQKADLQEDINTLATKLGLPVRLPAASGAGGGSTALPAGSINPHRPITPIVQS